MKSTFEWFLQTGMVDDEQGEADGPGWFGLYSFPTPQDRQAFVDEYKRYCTDEPDPVVLDQIEDSTGVICRLNDQGFLDYWFHDTIADLNQDWQAITDHVSPWYDQVESEC